MLHTCLANDSLTRCCSTKGWRQFLQRDARQRRGRHQHLLRPCRTRVEGEEQWEQYRAVTFWAIELSIKSSCIVQGGLGWKAGLQEQVQRFDKHVSDWISIEHGSSFLCFTPRIARWEWRTNEFAHRCKPSILRSQFLNADGSESSWCDCLVLPKQSCQDYFRCKFAWSYSSTALCPSIPICSTIVIPIFNI